MGVMVSGLPTQEVSPVAPPIHPQPHRHPYSLQVLQQIPLDLVRVKFCSSANIYELACFSYYNFTIANTFFTGSTNEAGNISALCSTSIAITAVVSCAFSFLTGALVGAVVYYCTVRKKCDCQKCYSLTMVRKQQQQQPAPVYEDVVGQPQNIELKENVAYGPVQQ